MIDREGFLTSTTLHALEPLLVNWPAAMASAVNGERSPVRSNGVNYTALGTKLAVSKFAAMREVMAAVQAKFPRSQNPWLEVNRRKSNPESRTSYGIKDLMKATGHSYTALLSRIDAGSIPGASYVVDGRTGVRKFAIAPHVYHSLAKHFRESNDVKGAALQVGCSEDAIRGLVRAKCLSPSSFLKSGFHYRLNPVQLAEMASRLFSLAEFVPKNASAERVYFSGWVRGPYCAQSAGRWRVLLEAVRSGTLKLYAATASPVQLNDLYLRGADLQGALAKVQVQG